MITVEIKIIPGGDDDQAFTTGLMVIANDGSGTEEVGNYHYAISHNGRYFGKTNKPWKSGRVFGFNRNESVFKLLRQILNNAGV